MQLKLKEDSREWQKFTTATAVLWGGVAMALWRRQVIGQAVLSLILVLLSLALLICLVRPRWYRPFYRVGMSLSLGLGQAAGMVLLTFFFLCVLTPVALVARLLGRDLLRLKKNSNANTYWQPAKPNEHFEREF